MEEKNLSVSASSASTMEKTNSTMSGQPLNIIGTVSFSEDHAEVESPNTDKEAESTNENARMKKRKLSLGAASIEHAASFNNGMKPQGSATPDSNDSAKNINSIICEVQDAFPSISRCIDYITSYLLNLQLLVFLLHNRNSRSIKDIAECMKILYELMKESLRLAYKSMESCYKMSTRPFTERSERLSDDEVYIISGMMKVHQLMACRDMYNKLLTIKFVSNENFNK